MEDKEYLNRLVKIMSEMLHEQQITNLKLEVVTQRVDNLAEKIDKVEAQVSKTNAGIGELRLSVMRLADEIKIVHDHDHRINLLERKVFA
jgi:peptidoglycan hydrolase CwlO-like protein